MNLSATEIRVLGCLMEKQRTTPDQYPLSLNALRLACNQSTNRDPVVQYDEAILRDALHRLERRGWVRLASGAGSRAAKYRHLLAEALPLGEDEHAVMCVLMLRGPQTPGELKQRTERMHPFADLGAVHATLEQLIARELVACQGRRPGQKEDRYAQLLSEDADAEQRAGVTVAGDAGGSSVGVAGAGPGGAGGSGVLAGGGGSSMIAGSESGSVSDVGSSGVIGALSGVVAGSMPGGVADVESGGVSGSGANPTGEAPGPTGFAPTPGDVHDLGAGTVMPTASHALGAPAAPGMTAPAGSALAALQKRVLRLEQEVAELRATLGGRGGFGERGGSLPDAREEAAHGEREPGGPGDREEPERGLSGHGEEREELEPGEHGSAGPGERDRTTVTLAGGQTHASAWPGRPNGSAQS